MRRRHAAQTSVAALAALLLLAVWQVPQWLDWTRYRSTIEMLATAALGQPVTIRGPISLALLPQPVLTASKVDVGDRAPASLSFHVEALRLRVALMPLLGGHVDAQELVLRGPDLRIPWGDPEQLRHRPPAWLAGFAARIEDGRLTIGQVALTGIDATLATLDTGALTAAGTVRFNGLAWHFTSRLTTAGPDGAAGLNLTIDGQEKAVGLGASFTGQLAQDGTLAGTIATRGPDLGLLLPAPPVPFRAEGGLTVSHGVLAAHDLAMDVGGSPARGALTLRMVPAPRLDIALAASRLDLDQWLPALERGRTTIAGTDAPIGFDVSAEAAPLGGGTLERVRASFELNDRRILLREARALLPGNGSLRLSGRFERDGARFEGDALLDAPVLRTTLRWIDGAFGMLPRAWLARLPDSVAQRAELSAHLVVGGGEVALHRLAGSLDDVPLSGAVGYRRGEPPVVTVDLTLDRMALDPFLPAHPADLAMLAGSASGLDAEVRLNVRQSRLAGTQVDWLTVDAGVEAGNVQLRRLEGTVLGARIAASGTLGDGGRLSAGRLSVATDDATRLADLLPGAWRATPALWHGPAKLDARFAGSAEVLSGEIQLAMADGLLQAAPNVDLKSGKWSTTVALSHPGARRLLGAAGLLEREGLNGVPGWIGDGSLSLVARLAGGLGRLTVEKFDLTAAALHAKGNLAIDLQAVRPRVDGRIDADTLTLPLPNGGSDVPLPLGLLHGWQGDVQIAAGQIRTGTGVTLTDAAARLVVADDRLHLDHFTARLGGGSVAGDAVFDASKGPPALTLDAGVSNASITGRLDDAPIRLESGRADASVRLAATGYSPSALLATLDGRATLKVQDGLVAGFDLFRLKQAVEKPDPKSAQAAVDEALRSGVTTFDRLEVSATITHGDVVLDAGSLNGAAGEAQASGGLSLANRMLDVRIMLHPGIPSPPQVALHLVGPIDRPSRTTELAELARWMAALVH